MERYLKPDVKVTADTLVCPHGNKQNILEVYSVVPIPKHLHKKNDCVVYTTLVDLDEGKPCGCLREHEPRLLILGVERNVVYFSVLAFITNCECGFLSKHCVLRMEFVFGDECFYADLHIRDWYKDKENVKRII